MPKSEENKNSAGTLRSYFSNSIGGRIANSLPGTHEIDTRTRQEHREDFEKKLSQIDEKWLNQLQADLITFKHSDPKKQDQIHDNLTIALTKFTRYIDEFKLHRTDEERKLSYKKKELHIQATHDWKNKFRLFFFRVLASALLVATLFAIGYIEHEYDWARLPLSKYFNPTSSLQIK